MKNIKRKLLVGTLAGALAGVIGGALFAQTTTIVQNLTGNEFMQATFGSGGPGGTSFYTTVNALRNAQGYLSVATGTTVNTTVPATASRVFNTGAITTWNVTLPLLPYDGEVVEVACSGGAASPVVGIGATPANATIVGTAFTTCASGGTVNASWQYSTSANKWYRVQ